MSETAGVRRRYVFGPRARSGLTYGVSWAQAALVAIALLVSVLLLRAGHGRGRLAVVMVMMSSALVMATWPIAGRTPQQWLPVLSRFALATLRGDRRSVPVTRTGPIRPRTTTPFSDFELREIEGATEPLGVLFDRANSSATAVIDVAGSAFSLADPVVRQQLVDAWANVLAATAMQAGSLTRLAWIERVVPDQAPALGVEADEAFVARADDAVEAARASYRALLAVESRRAVRHDSHVTVSVHADRGGAWEPLLAELAWRMGARCRDVGLGGGGLLSLAGLHSHLRHQFAGGSLTSGGRLFPLGVAEEWGAVRTDGCWHATYWVAEWPRTEVGCDFLLPLLQLPLRRTIAVVMEPLEPARAIRAAERTRTSNTADAALRGRHGFAVTARATREHDAAARREVELAAGHGAFRFAGFLSVTASSREQLQRDCERLEHMAAVAHLDLRRLYGSQRLALGNVLPAGRGL